MANTPEYHSWCAMKARCLNPNNKRWNDYGGRGITICDEWRHSFETFLRDVGPRPSMRYTLDRKDNNGNYEPGNVRWATQVQQTNNQRRNLRLTWRGETRSVSEWAVIVGLPVVRIYHRLDHLGWSVERTLSTTWKEQGGRGKRRYPIGTPGPRP